MRCRHPSAPIDFLEPQLDLISRIGIQNYGQLQAAPADDSKAD